MSRHHDDVYWVVLHCNGVSLQHCSACFKSAVQHACVQWLTVQAEHSSVPLRLPWPVAGVPASCGTMSTSTRQVVTVGHMRGEWMVESSTCFM
jgi:hypothetical protein